MICVFKQRLLLRPRISTKAWFFIEKFLKGKRRNVEGNSHDPERSFLTHSRVYIYIYTRRKESGSFFRLRTWGCSIEGVTFTCEPQFAVIPLVLEQLAQIRKHLPAIAADQDIRIACNVEKLRIGFHWPRSIFVV